MRRNIWTLLVALTASLTMSAQYVVSDKYRLWFEDSGHEVTTRKAVWCTEDYQDLWNGCMVKTSGQRIYIYRNNSSILYGDQINLLYNGYYRVRRGNTWYLADEDGDLVYQTGLHLVIDNCANNGIRNGEDHVRLAYPDPDSPDTPDIQVPAQTLHVYNSPPLPHRHTPCPVPSVR